MDTAGDSLTGLVMLTHNILVTASGRNLPYRKISNKNTVIVFVHAIYNIFLIFLCSPPAL